MKSFGLILMGALLSFYLSPCHRVPASPRPVNVFDTFEYLWYEAENMRGFSTGRLGEPLLNPSHTNWPREKAPGWGMNGPGVSAEWTQGGESEWNSAAASADETRATLYQDFEIPREGQYALWIRYADWSAKTENFTVTIAQDNAVVFRHEFGVKDVVDPPAGDALKIRMKLFGRIGGEMQFLKDRVIQLRQEPPNLVGAGKNPAKAGVRIARVAAEFRLGRFFQHDDSRRSRLSCRHRRFERRAASTHDHHRDVFSLHRC